MTSLAIHHHHKELERLQISVTYQERTELANLDFSVPNQRDSDAL